MANIIAILLLSFSTTLSIFILSIRTAMAEPKGLTIKLIHRDSPDSPLYQPNLTASQRAQNLVLQTQAHALQYHQYPKNQYNNSNNSNALRPKVAYQDVYLAQVGIGTLSSGPIFYFLVMDTGDSLIWTQCDTCSSPGHSCIPQREPLFPSIRSTSFRKLACNRHPLCYPRKCIGDFCSYNADYLDGLSSTGFLATEAFTFDTESTRKEVVPNMVFGCGFDQKYLGPHRPQGNLGGNLGLGWGPRSLVSQLGSRASGRFSYCLQPMTSGQNTRLRFGSDIPTTSGSQSTNLIQYSGESDYFISMIDMSIGGSRLRIPPNYFARRSGCRGTIIDSGSSLSVINTPAFQILERELVKHFARFTFVRRIPPRRTFSLCFQRSVMMGFTNLPNITFHLRGADLVVEPRSAFYVETLPGGFDFFCLAMVPFNGKTLIGAYQQANKRFTYDLNAKKLYFKQEDCLQNA